MDFRSRLLTVLDPTNRLGVTVGSGVWRPHLVGEPTVAHPTADAWLNHSRHPSFGLPNAELGSADFGMIRSTVSTPRQMQFGVKFLF